MKIIVQLTFIVGYLCTCNGLYNHYLKNQTLWHVIFDNLNQTYLKVPDISSSEQVFVSRLSKKVLDHNPVFDLSNIEAISPQCQKDYKTFAAALESFDFWAVKMHDATAKVSAGILNGNVNQYGDFDQCITTQASNEEFGGKYCLAFIQPTVPEGLKYIKYLRQLFLSFEAFKNNLDDPFHVVPKTSTINWGLCVPSSCSHIDIETALSYRLNRFFKDTGIDIDVRVDEKNCQVEKPRIEFSTFDQGTKLAIYFFAFLLLITFLSTIYEMKSKAGRNKNSWFTAFSLIKNGKDVFSIKRTPSDIPTPHGIRFFNTCMLLATHKCMEISFNPIVNRTEMSIFANKPYSVIVRASYLYTDSFIMLSGMLVAYSFIGRLQRGQTINIIKEIAGRYFRVAPPMIALMIFGTFILPLLGSGPQWNSLITFQSTLCKQTWWRSVLMIHNWFGFKNICMTHTHHIGTDFELFLIAPFLTICLFKWPKKGSMLIIGLAIASTVARYYITLVEEVSVYVDFGADVSKLYDISDVMYIIPPYRFTVYAIGIFLGYCLRRFKDLKLTKLQLNMGWFVLLTGLFLTIIGAALMSVADYKYNATNSAIYSAFAPISWCLFFAWVIFTSQLGHENKFHKLLSWRGFIITTNLSYGVYLTQFAVFHYNIGQQRSPQYFNFLSTININEYLCIVIASIFLTLLVDYPFGNLKKIIFDSSREAPKVEIQKVLQENNNDLHLNGNATKPLSKIE